MENQHEQTHWELPRRPRLVVLDDHSGPYLMAYGGAHLAASHSHYPTKTEMWLWRASALRLAGTRPVVVLLAIPALMYDFIN